MEGRIGMDAKRAFVDLLFPSGTGIFRRFPVGRVSCSTCPPGRADPLILRVLWRAFLPPLLLLKYLPAKFIPTKFIQKTFTPKNQTIIIILLTLPLLLIAISALLYGLIAESFIETVATGKENMNSVISAFFVLTLIAIPSYLMSKSPALYNVPTQIMFSIFLTVASTWFGISVNNKRARHEATAKWLPAAETACKQLLTLSATAERMRRTQARACDTIDPIIADGDSKAMNPVKALIRLQCQETSEKLANLRDHIENAFSLWQVFIGTNCEGDECALIDARLQERRQQLFSQIDGQGCGAAASDKKSARSFP
jgi:hypothetical protein